MSKCEGATDDMEKYLCPVCQYPLSDITTDPNPKNKLTVNVGKFTAEVKVCNKCGNVQMFACDYLKKRKEFETPVKDVNAEELR